MLAGAAMGRLVGQLLNAAMPASLAILPAAYALVGTAALLGGTMRMALSLAVIFLECTGSFTWGLPVAIALLVARGVGNTINAGIYDSQIRLRRWPYVGEAPELAPADSAVLRASDIMTERPVVFREVRGRE